MAESREPTPVRLSRVIAPPACALLVGFIGVQGSALLEEYQRLRREWDADVRGRVVGYPGVTPVYSYAQGPPNWIHDEGDTTRLWAGWDRKAGRHQWFTVGKGELSAARLSHPMGRDTVRAIDKPRTETRGGEIWKAIPPDDIVHVGEFQGVPLAYPLNVLNKTLIVNDEVHRKPFLVVYTPYVENVHAVDTFYPVVDGKRLTMGHSGYLWDMRPLLYDRERQSLWVPSGEGLLAIAGPFKGTVLGRVAHLDPARWGDWSAEHPEGRLIAGAIRDDLKNQKP
jgi:hypothetical protein